MAATLLTGSQPCFSDRLSAIAEAAECLRRGEVSQGACTDRLKTPEANWLTFKDQDGARAAAPLDLTPAGYHLTLACKDERAFASISAEAGRSVGQGFGAIRVDGAIAGFAHWTSAGDVIQAPLNAFYPAILTAAEVSVSFHTLHEGVVTATFNAAGFPAAFLGTTCKLPSI